VTASHSVHAARLTRCTVCAVQPVAMRGVRFCFACWPGGPVIPPPCVRCGARTGYFTAGLCRRCHRYAPPGADSCLDCYAWGATRDRSWLCLGCWQWRRANPTIGPCLICQRVLHLATSGAPVCRLCYRQAAMVRDPAGELDLVGANRHGQQLFLADMFHRNAHRKPAETLPAQPGVTQACARAWRQWQQLALLPATGRVLTGITRADLEYRADPQQGAAMKQHARDLATRLGWTDRLLRDTCTGLRIALGLREHRDEPVRASDAALLTTIDLPAGAVMRVLEEVGMLAEDRIPAFDAWAASQIAQLPHPMAAEVSIWLEVMKHGSLTPPRRRPRSQTTIELHLRWALPTLLRWAAGGYTSLREISRDNVVRDLPPSGNPRAQVGQGLKSIFRLLKARKVLFTDPTARVSTGRHEDRQPLPVNLDDLRDALNSGKPAHAAVAALIAFHGLTTSQVQQLGLTDVRDRTLHLDDRSIPLAGPVQHALAAYLDERQTRWPHTTNPYLFVTSRTASGDVPVSRRWIWQALGPKLSAAAVRQDRILDEAHATSGDVRRLADLFGLSVKAGSRYTATIDHPDLTAST
jgi:hypothetical protein